METRIKITPEECQAVEKLFNRFTAYCNILGYLGKEGSIETDIFDKKWEEAVEINNQLEKLKEEICVKYEPKDKPFVGYVFDFGHQELVFRV